MAMLLASGECWRVEAERDVVVVIVWRRPELSREDTAAFLKQTVAALVPLVEARYRGLVYDLRDGSSTWGPITHKAFVDVMAVWDIAKKPVAVVAPDEAIARIGVKSLVAEGAPRHGKACATLEEAIAHVAGGAAP